MESKIFSLRFGINTCYIIKGKGTIMIDGGPSGVKNKFKKYLTEFGIDPKEIRLVVLTHADFDHAGSASVIREITDAKIAIHENDRLTLEEGRFSFPPGVTTWGKISHAIFVPLLKRIPIPPQKADIILNDQEFPLYEYGIDGKIIYTPGHTSGHVSVLMENGDLFAGCLAHNIRMFTLRPNLPIYAEDIQKIKEQWKILIDKGVKMIYPGHGKPFPVGRIKKLI